MILVKARSLVATLAATLSQWWRLPETLRSYRPDWPECCRDIDELRRALDDIRRECGRQGV